MQLLIKSRSQGILSLEESEKKITIGYLKRTLSLLVDNYKEDDIRDILHTEMYYFKQRRIQQERLVRHAAKLAPAFGVAGSVIGLISMLSGIGDANHLKEKGINVVHDLKGVGKNLQDHLETYIQQECKTQDTLYTYTKLIPKVLAGIQWFLSKSGPCSQSYLEAGGFAKSSPKREIANIQFHFFPSFVIDHGLVNPSSHGYQLHASPNHPKSRGSITLNSSDPYDHPKILFNYLEHEDDLKQTRECIHVARKILSQPSLAKHAGKEVGPGSDLKSDDDLNEYIRSKAETAYHPCGTLKMGVDKMAVVDENLKIHGLQNIRVVDASVMPEIPSANLNAPTLMIAEKASDIISKEK